MDFDDGQSLHMDRFAKVEVMTTKKNTIFANWRDWEDLDWGKFYL